MRDERRPTGLHGARPLIMSGALKLVLADAAAVGDDRFDLDPGDVEGGVADRREIRDRDVDLRADHAAAGLIEIVRAVTSAMSCCFT